MDNASLPRKLGLVDASAIVVGTVIGSGIFIVPGAIARNLPSTWIILSVWLAAGVVSFFGALAFAELGAMMPSTGGQYVYLRESYGPFWAFLFGWVLFLVIRTGSTATLAVGFSLYLSYLFPLSPLLGKLAAAALIALLTWVNYRGVESGALVQNIFTFLKVLGLLLLALIAFLGPQAAAFQSAPAMDEFSWGQLGVAMMACLWAFNGWFAISLVAGEVKSPGRNLPRSLALGLAVIIAIYLLANLAYMKVLPLSEIAATDRVAAVMAERAIGPLGGTFVALTILLSIVGATNGGIMTAPRVYFAQARDGLFFQKLAEVHPRFQTPASAILVQGVWAGILALSGSYVRLFSFAMFAAWIFYGMTVAGVLILRHKYPALPRPYKMWGYPVTPFLFAAFSLWLVLNTLVTTPGPSLVAILIISSGIPVYYLWKRKEGALREDAACHTPPA